MHYLHEGFENLQPSCKKYALCTLRADFSGACWCACCYMAADRLLAEALNASACVFANLDTCADCTAGVLGQLQTAAGWRPHHPHTPDCTVW